MKKEYKITIEENVSDNGIRVVISKNSNGKEIKLYKVFDMDDYHRQKESISNYILKSIGLK